MTYTNVYVCVYPWSTGGETYILVDLNPCMCVCVRRRKMSDPCANRCPNKHNNTPVSSISGARV